MERLEVSNRAKPGDVPNRVIGNGEVGPKAEPLTTNPESAAKQKACEQEANINAAQDAIGKLEKVEKAQAQAKKGGNKKPDHSKSSKAKKALDNFIKSKKHDNAQSLEEIMEELMANLLGGMAKLAGGTGNLAKYGSILGPAMGAYKRNQARKQEAKKWPKGTKDKMGKGEASFVDQSANLLQKYGVEPGKPDSTMGPGSGPLDSYLSAEERAELSQTEQQFLQNAREGYHSGTPSEMQRNINEVYAHRQKSDFKPQELSRPEPADHHKKGLPGDVELQGNYDDPRDMQMLNSKADALVKHGVEGPLPEGLSDYERIKVESARSDYQAALNGEGGNAADLKAVFEHKQAAKEQEQKNEAAVSEIEQLNARANEGKGLNLNGDYSDPSKALEMKQKMDMLEKYGLDADKVPLREVPMSDREALMDARNLYEEATNEDIPSKEARDLKALYDERQNGPVDDVTADASNGTPDAEAEDSPAFDSSNDDEVEVSNDPEAVEEDDAAMSAVFSADGQQELNAASRDLTGGDSSGPDDPRADVTAEDEADVTAEEGASSSMSLGSSGTTT